MSVSETMSDERRFSRNMMTSFIQISALVLLVGACAMVVKPFAGIVLWGFILAVAVYPLHLKLTGLLGGREKLSATIITLVGLAIILVPGWLVTESAMETTQTVHQHIEDGDFTIPPPNERVQGWPVIGKKLYQGWSSASTNLQATLHKFEPQVRKAGERLLSLVSAMASGVLHFVASIIIAGVCLMFASKGYATTTEVCERISPARGRHFSDLIISTIRSVTNGVLGVAAIQAGLAGIGFWLIGLPAPGVFTLIILITAIIQIPAILIMVPLIIWVFSFAGTGAATVFAIYAILVALSDNVLKPMLLGRGVDLPVLIVLLGAIGGMITFGVIGLFIGAVILGLGYRIINDWIWSRDFDAGADSTDAAV
ncbi:MAG TPA: AI-2E family transporter [Woeseiaceae bacterium]|nr:AI-2E family transporter [Woeseiaceae bacterium]